MKLEAQCGVGEQPPYSSSYILAIHPHSLHYPLQNVYISPVIHIYFLISATEPHILPEDLHLA